MLQKKEEEAKKKEKIKERDQKETTVVNTQVKVIWKVT